MLFFNKQNVGAQEFMQYVRLDRIQVRKRLFQKLDCFFEWFLTNISGDLWAVRLFHVVIGTMLPLIKRQWRKENNFLPYFHVGHPTYFLKTIQIIHKLLLQIAKGITLWAFESLKIEAEWGANTWSIVRGMADIFNVWCRNEQWLPSFR